MRSLSSEGRDDTSNDYPIRRAASHPSFGVGAIRRLVGMPQPRQPFLHDLVCTLAAPTQAWSAYDGQIGSAGRAVGIQGVLHADVRVLAAAELLAGGQPPEHIATLDETDGTLFVYLWRYAADRQANPDAAVRIDRIRRVRPGRVSETITVTSTDGEPAAVDLEVRLAADVAPMQVARSGEPALAVPLGDDPLVWGDDELTVRVTTDADRAAASEDRLDLGLGWSFTLGPAEVRTASWTIDVADAAGAVAPASGAGLAVPDPAEVMDHRLGGWLRVAVADLNALRMTIRQLPDEAFFAAGAPWYLTLFGRDSLWAARMVLPLDPGPAIATLRVLALLAGTTTDADSAQQPGKIAHELRRETSTLGEMSLPPLYYGTIDATPLWVCLLFDLWRRGGHDAVVAELLDPLRAALRWIVQYGDADGDGFLEYIDSSGHGLANQGWKDSADSVRFADGRIATGPVALCEVQGYAYEALCGGSDLLESFDGSSDVSRYRVAAADLAERFRAAFWCGSGADAYPALALDGEKRRVDSLTSNIGHLLGTGLLSAEEELRVARRVASPAMDSGLGLRTMSDLDGGYNPLSYHCGSVWPHDTAIVLAGLQRAGLRTYGARLAEGLLRASVAFDQRVPELWSGEGRPVPYPSACRPQAWSAAAAVVVRDFLR